MKKFVLGFLGFIVISVIGVYIFRAPLMDFAMEKMTADMFVGADSDDFDPGIAVGEQFPQLETRYQGRILRDLSRFVRDKGMIFIANRSVDW